MLTGLRRAPRVRPLTGPEFRELLPDAFRIFADAMRYPQSYIEPRIRLARQQLGYQDLRVFGAFAHGKLIGFAYGYRAQPGQWWTDEVTRALELPGADRSRDWLQDAFELCEIHMSPSWQGAGVGRRLLRAITEAQPCGAVVLSTPTGPTRAAALYASEGYQALVSNFRFLGDPRDFEILGKLVGR